MIFKSAIQSIILKNLKTKINQQTFTEADLTPILKEIRTSFLAADVSVSVLDDFLSKVKAEALAIKQVGLNQKLDQLLLSIVRNNLISLLGQSTQSLTLNHKTNKYMVVGLNGSGKTTSCAKLAYYLEKKHQKNTCLVALDLYRPAAVEQLQQLANEVKTGFFYQKTDQPQKIAQAALNHQVSDQYGVMVFDTAGRMQTDAALMHELVELKQIIQPHEILLVVDGMAGQDIINVATSFHQHLKLSGLVITKADSDGRLGAAFSLAAVLKVPIKFLGTGESFQQWEQFHPERVADRILGMGDLVTLAEKAQAASDEQSNQKMLMRFLNGQFNLDDLVTSMKQLQKMGPLSQVLSMLPNQMKVSANKIDQAEVQMRLWGVILSSMTKKERKNPKLLKKEPNRKVRIIKGSGCKPDDFNKMMKRWDEAKKHFEQMAQMMKRGRNPLKMPFGR